MELDPCWIWQGRVDVEGYGQWASLSYAHRRVYELIYGPIPDSNMVVHHACRERCCVNPLHLELLTRGEHNRLHVPEREYYPDGEERS